MVDTNDEYVNDNLMINYDSKRFSLESCLNSHRNQTDTPFHSNNKRRKFCFFYLFFFLMNLNEKNKHADRFNKASIKR